MKNERGGSRPQRFRGCFPRLQDVGSIPEERLQAVGHILPIGIRTELGRVGSREKGGEAEQRIGGEEAVFAGRRRVEQQVDVWVPVAKFGQGAGLSPAKDADLARFTQDQRLGRRHDVGVAAPGAQQPDGDGCVKGLIDRFQGGGHRGEVAGVALVQAGERMGAGEGAAGADDAKRRKAGDANGLLQGPQIGALCPGEGLRQPRHLSRVWPRHSRPQCPMFGSRARP